MARIRTIKPGLFRDSELYQAEVEANLGREGKPYLNIRFAFAGLFTAADKRGRFKWRPNELKLDCLPHDPVDFAEVMAVLARSGRPPFVVRYEHEGQIYGWITGFEEHQRPHHTELESTLPPFLNGVVTVKKPLQDGKNLEGREGKGREWKGKEGNGAPPPSPAKAIIEMFAKNRGLDLSNKAIRQRVELENMRAALELAAMVDGDLGKAERAITEVARFLDAEVAAHECDPGKGIAFWKKLSAINSHFVDWKREDDQQRRKHEQIQRA